MIFASVLIGLSAAAPGVDSPILLGRGKQLFLDDYLIASKTNVRREVHAARKDPRNPLLWPSEPWESPLATIHGSVIRDGGTYKMWYISGHGLSYAESDDGIAWRKPGFDLVTVDGQPTNVLVANYYNDIQPKRIPYFYVVLGVHKDERDPDPSRRYKMGFLSIHRGYEGPRADPFHRSRGGQRRGLGVAGSPDGIHWTLIDNWATESICDGPAGWLFDAARDKYVFYGRTKFLPPELAKAWLADEWYKRNVWGRAVVRLESPDFLKWDFTDPAQAPVVMAPDAADEIGTEIYSMKVFAYGAVHIGLVHVFYNQPGKARLDIQLAVSRDGVQFTRVADRSPFIGLGEIGSWDRFNNSVANNPPIADGDELRFYYGGRMYRHSPYQGKDDGPHVGGIGLATIKRDRFVSLAASFDGGRVVTKPLKLGGKTLHLNAVSDFGEILVELLDLDGAQIARSKPVKRDGLDIPVEWEQGSLEQVAGPVVLRITLKNSRLFAIWCT